MADARTLLEINARLKERIADLEAKVQRAEAWANQPGRSGQIRDGVLRALAGNTEGAAG